MHERTGPREQRERLTTVNIYAADLERLREHQRRISFAKSDQLGARIWITMSEVVRALINAAEAKAETGE
jgi:hypothetical protein